jgi:excisionase family DNA binding protein
MNELLTIDEVAEYLKLNSRTIRSMIKRKQIPGFMKVGHQWRIDAADLQKYLDSLKKE